MNVLVVYSHPCPESFTAAVRDTILATLTSCGHMPDLLDLYGEGFDPVMDAQERRGYHDAPHNIAPIRTHAERLRWADALIFVYPTWWFGLPAMLKGWLERVFVPGFAFQMPGTDHGARPNLTHIRRLGAFTTCGASRLETVLIGQPGKRTVLRGVRSVCHPLTRVAYVAMYKMDTATDAARRRHLDNVSRGIRRLVGAGPAAVDHAGPPVAEPIAFRSNGRR